MYAYIYVVIDLPPKKKNLFIISTEKIRNIKKDKRSLLCFGTTANYLLKKLNAFK